LEIIEDLFYNINEHNLEIYLVNEDKSSKIKLHKLLKNLSKHEASALILALRDGINVNRNNYKNIISQIKINGISKKKLTTERRDIGLLKNNFELMKQIFIKIIKSELSVEESYEIIREKSILNNLSKK
jgi:hypothetical protein